MTQNTIPTVDTNFGFNHADAVSVFASKVRTVLEIDLKERVEYMNKYGEEQYTLDMHEALEDALAFVAGDEFSGNVTIHGRQKRVSHYRWSEVRYDTWIYKGYDLMTHETIEVIIRKNGTLDAKKIAAFIVDEQYNRIKKARREAATEAMKGTVDAVQKELDAVCPTERTYDRYVVKATGNGNHLKLSVGHKELGTTTPAGAVEIAAAHALYAETLKKFRA